MKIRHGFVSNSSSTSYVIAFNPKYNMKGKKKIDEFGDVPFNKIIDLYGQAFSIFDSADALKEHWCDVEGVESGELIDMFPDKVERLELAQDLIPKDWHWAEVGQAEGTASKISGIVDAMKDLDLVGGVEGTEKRDPDTLDGYDFDNGYMVVIHKA